MPDLQTIVKIPAPEFNISYSDNIALFGSCFSDNIGALLHRFKFNTTINPFGVLYNPASIAEAIKLLSEKETFTDDDLHYHHQLWFSYSHHTSFSAKDKTSCLENINARFLKAKEQISEANVIMLTLGTSWIYKLASTGRVVANCHKIPAREFNREFLEPSETAAVLAPVLRKLLTINPSVQFVFTVSPIRHWKDGAIENTRSKAALHLAIRQLQSQFSNAYYFPSYEIFMDELRDYRYYAADMLHPSEFAVNYLWDRVKNTFFDTQTLQYYSRVEKLVKSFSHRPFNPDTDKHQQFRDKLFKESIQLEKQLPGISFKAERNSFV